ICNRLNIRMSTIHKQVERKIFEKLRIPGFVSLVKSARLLKEVMKKLGILMEEFTNEEINEDDEILEIELGNGMQVFNAFDTFDYYFYAIKDLENKPILFSMAVDRKNIVNIFEKNDKPPEVIPDPDAKQDQLFNLAIWRVKDPPLII
ncbi:MAG: hypothetical protein ACFE8V_12380, partial [Promethearchaeota archaeon]